VSRQADERDATKRQKSAYAAKALLKNHRRRLFATEAHQTCPQSSRGYSKRLCLDNTPDTSPNDDPQFARAAGALLDTTYRALFAMEPARRAHQVLATFRFARV